MSSILISIPVTVSPILKNLLALSREMNAMDESYSYMPNSKTADTLNLAILGTAPAGVIVPDGDIRFTSSPTEIPRLFESSLPIAIPAKGEPGTYLS